MNFLQLTDKTILIFGLANRKSVAWHVARVLEEAGANVIFSVRSEQRKESLAKLVDPARLFVCDVEHQSQIDQLREEVGNSHEQIHGIVHSIAFADYSAGWLPFHETPRAAFLQALDISCFSLVAIANAFRDLLDEQQGSVVTISISTTRMAAENYGYMAPVKAALDSSICFLAKSFSQFSSVRFNAVCPGFIGGRWQAAGLGSTEKYEARVKAVGESTPLRRANTPEDIAETVVWFVEGARWVTGETLLVDAGSHLR